MLETKLFELRDTATFIPIVATRVAGVFAGHEEQYLIRRAGYPMFQSCVLLGRLDGTGMLRSDPTEWGDRTMAIAHRYITSAWPSLRSGEVVDVEFILGETEDQKPSERETVNANHAG